MRLCRVYVQRRLLLIHPFRCVMLFFLVWSRDVVVVVVIVLVLVSVVVIVVVAAVVVDVLLLLFGCESRSGSDRPCACLEAIGCRRSSLRSVWLLVPS